MSEVKPVAWVDVPQGEQACASYPGYTFHGIERLPQGKHALITLAEHERVVAELLAELERMRNSRNEFYHEAEGRRLANSDLRRRNAELQSRVAELQAELAHDRDRWNEAVRDADEAEERAERAEARVAELEADARRWAGVYHAGNKLLAAIVSGHQLNIKSGAVLSLMEALHVIDGGQYNEQFPDAAIDQQLAKHPNETTP